MAKQTGIHGLRGKVNGMSYYSSKNGGKLVRTINEGLGARVKTDKAYVNTRKNNAEFGACGDFAGAFIGAISSRWRFILNSIATGLMVKAAKAALIQDSAHPWGHRSIPETQYSALQEAFNGLSKNIMPEAIVQGAQSYLKYDGTTNALKVLENVEIGAELSAELAEIGASGFFIDVYRLGIDNPVYSSITDAYSKASSDLQHLDNLSSDVNTTSYDDNIFTQGDSTPCEDFDQADATYMPVAFVLFRPYRTIGGEKSVLQQHCAGWVYVPEEVGE